MQIVSQGRNVELSVKTRIMFVTLQAMISGHLFTSKRNFTETLKLLSRWDHNVVTSDNHKTQTDQSSDWLPAKQASEHRNFQTHNWKQNK